MLGAGSLQNLGFHGYHKVEVCKVALLRIRGFRLMRVPSKVANRGSAGNTAGALEARIPNAFRRWEIERAPSTDAQIREVLLFEVRGDGTAQTVERYDARWTRNLPFVRWSAEGKGTERYRRDPQTFSRIAAENSTHQPRRTAHSFVDGPSDVMDGLRCILA